MKPPMSLEHWKSTRLRVFVFYDSCSRFPSFIRQEGEKLQLLVFSKAHLSRIATAADLRSLGFAGLCFCRDGFHR